jgi:sugar lactone lactonase YvrE
VLVFNQGRPGVLRFDPKGKLVNAWGDRFGGAHGMTLTREGDQEFLWLTDQNSGEVAKTTLDGETVLSIRPPEHPIYAAGKRFVPTWVAVNEERFGGNGDVWVTDGYGSSHIHRYTKTGGYVSTINGTEGKAGAFSCPHGIRFDYRHGQSELYIADRSNRRIQVYDASGKYLRHFGADFLHSPCMFDVWGDYLLVPELFGRVSILDKNDKLVAYLGCNDGIEKREGWPNQRGHVGEGRFNSPHAMTADAAGNLYVVEWIVGGRVTKLAKV